MKKERKILWFAAVFFLAAFALWTAAVCRIDVQPIGPLGSEVGFASLNRLFHDFTGVHLFLYTLTDRLSLIPAAFALGFALQGLVQWFRRRSLLRVDRSILVLGGLYLAVMAFYIFFEIAVVNHRPILIGETLEASYPSSTTLLVMCILPTAILQLRSRIRSRGVRRAVTALLSIFAAFMVTARLLSGVHWLTDIIGGALLSAGLVLVYCALTLQE